MMIIFLIGRLVWVLMVLLLPCSGKKKDKTSEKDVKNVKVDTEVTTAIMKASNGKGSQKAIDVEKKETKDKIDKGQKVRPLSVYATSMVNYYHHTQKLLLEIYLLVFLFIFWEMVMSECYVCVLNVLLLGNLALNTKLFKQLALRRVGNLLPRWLGLGLYCISNVQWSDGINLKVGRTG